MKIQPKIKKRQGVIFQSGKPQAPTDDQLANQKDQQKSLDADAYRKKLGSSESLHPVPPALGPERY